MEKPGEAEVTLGYGSPPSYETEEGTKKLDLVADAVDGLFAHADELHRDQLPKSISFANHNLAGESNNKLYGLEEFFREYSEELMSRVIGIRLRLNDYVEGLGLGIVSVSVEPFNDMGGNIILPEADSKPPTIGNVLPPMELRAQVLACFKIDEGNAEQVDMEGGKIYGRTYAFNERPSPYSTDREPDQLPDEGAIIVTEGSHIGISVPVLKPGKFERTRLPYQEVGKHVIMDDKSQLYICRNLTAAAALRIIRGEENE